jgi:hypothetical protein
VSQDRTSSQTFTSQGRSSNTTSTPASLPSRNSSPNQPLLPHPNISELAANDAAPRGQIPIRPAQPRVKNSTPMELPADVPEQVLSQAPHSNKSRLSMAFGSKTRESTEKQSSQIITAKSLGSLLKSPLRSRQSLSSASKDTTNSKATSTVQHTEVSNGYFGTTVLQQAVSNDSQAVFSSSQGHLANQGLGIQDFSESTKSPQISNVLSQRHMDNPTFASYPPEMRLGTKPILPGNGSVKPAELSSETPYSTRNEKQHSREISLLSSLGEPGPEVECNETTVSEVTDKQATSLLNTIARRTLLSAAQPPLDQLRRSVGGEAAQAGNGHDTTVGHSHDPESTEHAAEMEGSSPILLAPLTFGPVELEAPQQILILPPRPGGPGNSAVQSVDLTSATITSQSDFFKLPALQHAEGVNNKAPTEAEPQPASGHASMPILNLSGRVDSVGDGRSSLPPRLSGLKVFRKEAPPLSRNRSDLIEHISHTPPESPIHARSVSQASSNSARIKIERPSRSLAPPLEAPPPPGPGGRPMVTPDYAAAGVFEGERRSKHSSRGSGSSWRKLLPGAITPLSPTVFRPGSNSINDGPSSDVKNSGVNMMTAGGKDVLWFKGMNRDSVWVSSR